VALDRESDSHADSQQKFIPLHGVSVMDVEFAFVAEKSRHRTRWKALESAWSDSQSVGRRFGLRAIGLLEVV
jgi:hypothetical protein